MRWLWALLVVPLLFAGCAEAPPPASMPALASQATTQAESDPACPVEAFSYWRDTVRGYEFAFPRAWAQQANPPGFQADVLLVNPDAPGEFAENLNVLSVERAPMSVDEAFDAARAELRAVVTDFAPLREEMSSVHGVPALYFTYSGRVGVQNLTWNQVTLLNGSSFSTLTLTSLSTTGPSRDALCSFATFRTISYPAQPT